MTTITALAVPPPDPDDVAAVLARIRDAFAQPGYDPTVPADATPGAEDAPQAD